MAAHRYWRLIVEHSASIATTLLGLQLRSVAGVPQGMPAGALFGSAQLNCITSGALSNLIAIGADTSVESNGVTFANLTGYNLNAGNGDANLYGTCEILIDLLSPRTVVELALTPYTGTNSGGAGDNGTTRMPVSFSLSFGDSDLYGPYTAALDIDGQTWGTVTRTFAVNPNVQAYTPITLSTTRPRIASALARIGQAVWTFGTIGAHNDYQNQPSVRQVGYLSVEIAGANYSHLFFGFDRFARIGTHCALPSKVTVRATLVNPGQTTAVPLYFNGVRDKLLYPGDCEVLCDDIPASAFGLTQFSRGEVWTIKIIETYSSGHCTTLNNAGTSPTNPTPLGGVEYTLTADAVLSDSDTPENWSWTGASAAYPTFGYTPYMLGRPIGGDPVSLVAITDSIIASGGPTEPGWGGVGDGTELDGWGVRAAQRVSAGKIAFFNLARDACSFTVGDGCFDRYKRLFKYANVYIDESGANDLFFKNAVQHQADVLAAVAAFRLGNINTKAIRTHILPRTNSSDGFVTVVNQSYQGQAWYPGDQVDQFNAWIPSKVADGTFDYYLPFTSMLDATTPQKFGVGAGGVALTPDGTHPSIEGNRLMANDLVAVLNGISISTISAITYAFRMGPFIVTSDGHTVPLI